jgi:protocatechuate 3,4-dioxygenase alpha subunit
LSLQRTPSQTVGPYLAIAMRWEDGPLVVPRGTPGAFRLHGRVLDGAKAPVDDAVVETWQADANGRFVADPDPSGFCGFGRSATDSNGRWEIITVKPGRVRGADGALQAPHLSVAIFARGLLKPVWTRIYFGDEPEFNASDAMLRAVVDDRRSTLVAQPRDDGYALDFRLQGEPETVFFQLHG